MKLTEYGYYSTSHAVTHNVLEKVNFNDAGHIYYRIDANPGIEQVKEGNDSEILRLVMNWEYIIFYDGLEIFDFKHANRYNITEIGTKSDIKELNTIVRKSHRKLQSEFEERRKEFTVFSPMSDISYEKIQLITQRVEEELLHLHEQKN